MKKRILIVNVNWVGDVLFSTPFIRAVRDRYPDAYIACLLHPRCREVLEGNPRLDEIIIYDEEGLHRGLTGKLRLINKLRKRRFDTAFLLHRSFTKALIALFAGAKERIGYPTKHRSILLTTPVEEPDPELHKVEYFLNIARSAGIEAKEVSYEFFIEKRDEDYIAALLKENGIGERDLLVVFCPGGNWEPKRWPKENFAAISDSLAERFGAKIVIAGAEKDRELAAELRGLMKASSASACGRTTLKQLGALFKRADLVIANDTGPMHLAVAMKAKVIAIFGPTSPALTGPYGRGSYKVISKNDICDIPCYDMTCADNRCMALVRTADVLKEAQTFLATAKAAGKTE